MDELENLKGKVFTIKIVGMTKNKKYFVGNMLDNTNKIYIEDTGDFYEEELIGREEKCVVIDILKGHLIGFLLSNRKFINDMKKIKKKRIKENEKGVIGDIYLLERLTINGKVIGLYLVEDQEDIKRYFLGEEEIGVYTDQPRQGKIIWRENTIENQLKEQIKDVIASIDIIKKEISLNKEEEKQKHIIEKELNLEEDRQITRIATIDLKQKVQIEDKEKQNIEKIRQVMHIQQSQIKKESTEKDVQIKQEMDMNDKVTDMHTLEKLLEKNGQLPKQEGKKFTKLGIIESDERDELRNQNGEKAKVNTTRYSFVAIANDGSVVPLNLEQDHAEGNNPREINYQVRTRWKC